MIQYNRIMNTSQWVKQQNINSLVPGWYDCNFDWLVLKHIVTDIFTDDESMQYGNT